MFREWRERSNYGNFLKVGGFLYNLARAAFKAGVRAGIKQEQASRKK